MTLLVGRKLVFKGVEKADELLMGVPLHAASDDAAFEHVQSGSRSGGVVPFIVVFEPNGSLDMQQDAAPSAVRRRLSARHIGADAQALPPGGKAEALKAENSLGFDRVFPAHLIAGSILSKCAWSQPQLLGQKDNKLLRRILTRPKALTGIA